MTFVTHQINADHEGKTADLLFGERSSNGEAPRLDQPNAAFPMRQENLPQLRRQTVRCDQPRRLNVTKQGVVALAMLPPCIVNTNHGSGEAIHQL